MVMGKNARREPGRTTRREYLNAIRPRYKKADKAAKKAILDEFCRVCGRRADSLPPSICKRGGASASSLRYGQVALWP